MKPIAQLVLCGGIHLAAAGPVLAYEQPTHKALTARAVRQSDLAIPGSDLLQVLGLTDSSQLFQATAATDDDEDSPDAMYDGCRHGSYYPIDALVGCGAEFEDAPGTRSVNHFFDPINNIPLRARCVVEPEFMTSPDWVLNDQNNAQGQHYSYLDAHDAFYHALTTSGVISASGSTPARPRRDQYWGRLFQTLGQVVHHLQDMAQPQHVRNDEHVDKLVFALCGLYAPSYYEAYTNAIRRELAPLMTGVEAEPIYSKAHTTGFSTARDFWINAKHTGIAELTNRNFVSAGTNFQLYEGLPVTGVTYPEPLPGPPAIVSVSELNPSISSEILTYCASLPSCDMTFYPTNLGTQTENGRASTLSIFDQKVRLRPIFYTRTHEPSGDPVSWRTDRLFSLNRYNFSEAHKKLIPTAVSYSAGLINFFFRGRLRISLPDEGVYAMIDHTDSAGNDPLSGGFPTIKLKIQNITSSGEEIPDGTFATGRLVAVAKFHRNNCYASDLSGEYGSPFNQASCRLRVEEIVVSDPREMGEIPAGINTGSVPVSFSFRHGVIPISATDLVLQVVYRGPLGKEHDSVVVATKDISEPTYISEWTAWDQGRYCSGWPTISMQGYENCSDPLTFIGWCAFGFPQSANPDGTLNNEACNRALGFTYKFQYTKDATRIPGYDPLFSAIPQGAFRPISEEPLFHPVVTLVAPVGTLPRVAALFDADPQNKGVMIREAKDDTHNDFKFQWFAIDRILPSITGGTDTAVNWSMSYGRARGVYVDIGDVPALTPPSGVVVPPLILVRSTFAGNTPGAWYWPN